MVKQKKHEEEGDRQRRLRIDAEQKLAQAPGAAAETKERIPEELIHELQVHQIELEMQNEELKKTRLALEESRDKYVDLYDFAPVGYATLNHESLIQEINLTGAALLGVERKKLINGRFRKFIDPEDADRWDRHFVGVLHSEEKRSCELKLRRRDGSTFYGEIDGIKREVTGQAPLVHITMRDITERKQAEELLRESEERYRTITENMTDTVWVMDMNFKYTYISPSGLKARGFTLDELDALPLDRNYTPQSFEIVARVMAEELTPERLADKDITISRSIELEYYRKDGSTFWADVVLTLVRDAEGRPKEIIGVGRDTTERKRTETLFRIRLSLLEYSVSHSLEQLLQEALDEVGELTDSPIGFYHFVDEDQKGLTLRAWSTKTLQEFCKAEGKGMHYEIDQAGVWVDCVHERRPVIHNDYASLPHKRGMPEGHANVVREVVVPIIRSGRIVAILGIGNKPTDYTQADVQTVSSFADLAWEIVVSMRTDEALRESEEKFRTVADYTFDWEYWVAPDGSLIYVSPACERITGYRAEEFMADPGLMKTITHPDDRKKHTDHEAQCVNEPALRYDFRITTRSGEIRWIGHACQNVYGSDGSPLGRRANNRDITERIRAEEALRESEELYRELIENIEDIVYVTDGTGKIIFLNNAFERISGYTREEMLQKHYMELLTPESLKEVLEFFKKQKTGQDMDVFEMSFFDKDRAVKTIEVREKHILEGGRVVEVHGLGRDITERKRAEELTKESEDKYKLLVENANDGIVIVQDGLLIFTNQRLSEMVGYSIEDAINTSFTDYIHPDEIQKVADRYQRRMAGEEVPSIYESALLHKDGHRVDVELNASVFTYRGKPTLQVTIRDNTERKRAEEELRESEEKYRALFESSKDTVYLSSVEGQFVDINPAGEELFGYSRDELLAMQIKEIYVCGDDRDVFVTDITEKGFAKDYEVTLKRKDGTPLDCLITATVRLDPKGKVIGGIIRDITHQKKIEAQLLQSEKLSSLGGILSGVAHELNNPLTSIIGHAQLLVRRDIPAEFKDKLEVIQKESIRCSKIVGGLLTFAREHKPERRILNINDIIMESYKLREYEYRVDSIAIELDLAADLPETAVDPFQFQQVFINLINNAHDALLNKNGGMLTISSRHTDEKIRIEFADNGVGIPNENRKKIFDPFFTTKDVGKGTGLGLSIIYGIVAEHGGMIDVESKVGEYTKFIIELPIVKHVEPIVTREWKAANKPVEGKTILVIDDEDSLREMITEALTGEGYIVESTNNGQKALDVLEKGKFDAVISDMKMPVMGGKELYVYLVNQNPDLAKRIIFITGDVLGQETQQFLNITGNRYIEKPFEIPDMLSVLSEVLSNG